MIQRGNILNVVVMENVTLDWSLKNRLRLSALYKKVKLVAFDFDGVFTDNYVYVLPDGTEAVKCSRADGIGLDMLIRAGVNTCVISGEVNPIVGLRCDKLKISCFQGIGDKLSKLREVADYYKVRLEDTAYVGNDINDLACLQAVGLPITVADALLDDDYGFYRTTAKGGEGAVREVCEQIARAKGQL